MFAAAGAGFGFGVAVSTATFLMLRDLLIGRALDRREREVYGPLLMRVEHHEAAARARRAAATRPLVRPAVPEPVLPSPRHRRDEHAR
jgi:hypothetical protein